LLRRLGGVHGAGINLRVAHLRHAAGVSLHRLIGRRVEQIDLTHNAWHLVTSSRAASGVRGANAMSVGNEPRHRRKASQLKLRLLRARDSGADHYVARGEGNFVGGRSVDDVLRFLALGAAVAVSSPAAAQSINQFVGFGDSTIDSGWYRNNIVNGQPVAGAPSEISLLAENPVKSRAATIDLIMNQIPISQRTRGPLGFNVWASGDVSRLQIDRPVGFVGESATPTQVTAGIDTMSSGGILLGVAVSAGTKKAKFSQGGSFTQDEFSVSGYTAATLGPLWLNMIGTFGALHYDVNRVVPLGPVLKQNNTTTNGTNMSFSVRTGHNTVAGPVTFGPVIGLTLQSVHIDGFTESGNVTSLAFSDQYRHSALGVLGYQASFDFGKFQPFAKVLWNHEFVSHDRLVTASLTPSDSLPAVDLGKDWASATAGVSVGLGKGVTGLVSFTGQLGQDKVTNYGGQVGLNVAF